MLETTLTAPMIANDCDHNCLLIALMILTAIVLPCSALLQAAGVGAGSAPGRRRNVRDHAHPGANQLRGGGEGLDVKLFICIQCESRRCVFDVKMIRRTHGGAPELRF